MGRTEYLWKNNSIIECENLTYLLYKSPPNFNNGNGDDSTTPSTRVNQWGVHIPRRRRSCSVESKPEDDGGNGVSHDYDPHRQCCILQKEEEEIQGKGNRVGEESAGDAGGGLFSMPKF